MPQLTNIAEMTTGFYFLEESRNIQDGTEEEVTNLLAKLDGIVINPLMKDTLVWNHSKVVGFKSFDVERISGTSGIWFEWTERSRKAVTRTTFNKGSMEWIVRVLKEASQTKGNSVCRWRKTNDIAEIFGARNYNKYGRYISLISVRGRRRSVLIIPELTCNSGWADIAEKVARFISAHKTTNNLEAYRTVDENIPYAEMVRSSKWENREGSGVNANAEVTMQKWVISIKEPICNHSEALKRSLVGKFNADATLTEVRKWSYNTWKQAYGLNVYEMGNNFFLFEFKSIQLAQQVMEGIWEWKKTPVKLIWWNPLVATVEERSTGKSTWVKIPTPSLVAKFFQSHWKSLWWLARNRGGDHTEEPPQMGEN
ncbi:hypothetical protein MTR67_043935 [Solanum verrucosum]|uniref:DUF4283 domain-containing protein n=1 Tax=Solanum verrucosum TaxID=315347 RepID=A0AAF0UR91_SOLVR|nr:hypothetical protein MTR67_043935 [Solanum verrucosum]